MPLQPPNILLAITDDWSFGHAGAYGCGWVRTPSFDRIAAEGLLFSRAYTPNAKCSPSRASLLTGRNSWQLKEACNHAGFFPPEFKVYPEALAEAGYFVGATNKGWAPGVALTAGGQPRSLVGTLFDACTARPSTPAMQSNDYAANFSAFLSAAPADRPWCFWFGSSDPHRPYAAGSGNRLGGKPLTAIERIPACWPDNDTVRGDLLDYAYAVEHFDSHLGRMLEELDRAGLADNTIVVVTSDHGMPFPRAKGQAYPAGNHVPLAVRWPSGVQRPGRLVDGLVSHIDLAPTLLEAAGVPWAQSGLAPAPGRSLAAIFRAEMGATGRDHVLLGQERHDIGRPGDVGYPIRGRIDREWLYLQNFEPDRWPACNPETGYLNCDGSPTKTQILRDHRERKDDRHWQLCFGKRPGDELYDLTHDPDCLVNLAAVPAQSSRVETLRRLLHAELLREEDPRLAGQGEQFDRYPVARPEMRQFYEKWQRGSAPNPDWVQPSDFESTV